MVKITWKTCAYIGAKMVGLTVYRDGRCLDGIQWIGPDEYMDQATWSRAEGSFHESSVMQRVVLLVTAGVIDQPTALEMTADLQDCWERCQPKKRKVTPGDLIRGILEGWG